MSSKHRIPKEFLGAFKCGHTPNRREFIDEEFSWQLLDKIQASGCQESRRLLLYIAKFNHEYYGANLRVGDTDTLHEVTPELVRAFDHDNYARKNDVLNAPNVIYLSEVKEKNLADRQVYLEPLFGLPSKDAEPKEYS